jgi:signal peptidase I
MSTETSALEASEQPVPEARHRESVHSSVLEYAESLLVTVLLALFGTTFIVQAFKIPSQSMEPTLLVGDHLLVNKFVFEGRGAWYEKFLPYRPVRHGDIIVFKFPFDDHPHYVKRVIGLPGDRLRIINQRVYINGEPLEEPYVVHDPLGADSFGDDFPPTNRYFLESGLRAEWATRLFDYVDRSSLVIPPNRYFVMGDNRDRSWDSRYWGFVSRDAIMGRPLIIYWSVAATSKDYGNRTLSGVFRGFADSLLHIPSRTRWNRLLHGVH